MEVSPDYLINTLVMSANRWEECYYDGHYCSIRRKGYIYTESSLFEGFHSYWMQVYLTLYIFVWVCLTHCTISLTPLSFIFTLVLSLFPLSLFYLALALSFTLLSLSLSLSLSPFF